MRIRIVVLLLLFVMYRHSNSIAVLLKMQKFLFFIVA